MIYGTCQAVLTVSCQGVSNGIATSARIPIPVVVWAQYTERIGVCGWTVDSVLALPPFGTPQNVVLTLRKRTMLLSARWKRADYPASVRAVPTTEDSDLTRCQ